MRGLISWFGGKFYMKKKICEVISKADCKMLVDGFGGSGVISLNSDNKIIVYNDIHEGLYLLFKTLRDDQTRSILIEKLQLTPYSRQEFLSCRDSWRVEKDVIEKVRMFYVTIMQAVGSTEGAGWSYDKTISRRGMAKNVSAWLGNVDKNLVEVVEKLREFQIEQLDIFKLIDKYDKDDTVFYLDPPYVQSTRESNIKYHHEFNDEDHKRLVDKLISVKGKVVLSGYDSILYNRLLDEENWSKILLGDFKTNSNKKGTEYLWINYKI